MVERRLEIVSGISVLEFNENVLALVKIYDQKLGMSGRAKGDLPHFAFAVAYEMDFLVTWNCAHIANGRVIHRLLDVNTESRRFTPLIVTPEEILEII